MYPIQTQQQKIIRILLILFIINQVANFVFGAPVAVREKLEGCIDADGTDDGTPTLQKRVNPVEKGPMNMAGQTPPGSDRTEADRLWEGMGQLGTDLKPRHIPTSRTSLFSKRAPPPPTKRPTSKPPTPRPYTMLLTNLRKKIVPPYPTPRPFYPPVRISHPYLPYYSYVPVPLRHASPPPPPEERLQPAPLLTTNNPSTTSHQLISQQNSGPDLDVHPPPNLEPQSLGQPPPNSEPRPLSNLEHPSPNSGPHPSTSGEMPVDEVLDVLKDSKLKRTFPAPVL